MSVAKYFDRLGADQWFLLGSIWDPPSSIPGNDLIASELEGIGVRSFIPGGMIGLQPFTDGRFVLIRPARSMFCIDVLKVFAQLGARAAWIMAEPVSSDPLAASLPLDLYSEAQKAGANAMQFVEDMGSAAVWVRRNKWVLIAAAVVVAAVLIGVKVRGRK